MLAKQTKHYIDNINPEVIQVDKRIESLLAQIQKNKNDASLWTNLGIVRMPGFIILQVYATYFYLELPNQRFVVPPRWVCTTFGTGCFQKFNSCGLKINSCQYFIASITL